jgi:ABC-2 type transport system ATP-binding protein
MIAVNCSNVSKYFSEWQRCQADARSSVFSKILSCLAYTRKIMPALQGVSFKVRKGEIFGLLGANGSGKSTLIRLMSTLLLPDEGIIEVFGRDVVQQENEVRKIINRVSVEASFFKKLSAWENLSYTARLYGLPIREARERIEMIMEKLGFSYKKLDESLENLSRGMQQKVAIARALLTSPSLLLLDEPTTGLDPRSKRQVQEFIREINVDRGITTILTTHDMQEADRLCHRIGIMREGRLVILGTPRELKELKGAKAGDTTLEEVFLSLADEEQGATDN